MFVPELPQRIVDATLAEGGVAMNLAGGTPHARYIVSLPGNESRIPIDEFAASDVASYIYDHSAQLGRPDRYVGTWTSSTGMVYLDVSVSFDSERDAHHFAYEWQQQAFYDMVSRRSVKVTQ